MTSFFKKHYIALFASIVVGFICVLPSILAPLALGDDYKGVPFFHLNNEEYYLARMQEIVDGHLSVASPVFYEYKDQLATVPPVGEFLYVVIASLFNISLLSSLILGKFLFPTILFLLVYFLLYSFTGNGNSGRLSILAGLSGGFLVVLGYDFIDFNTALTVLTGSLEDTQLNVWTRPVNPITGALFLFGYLNLLWKLFQNPNRESAFWTGVLLSLCVGYIFAWGIGLLILTFLLLYSLVSKEWKLSKLLCMAGAVSILIDLPFLVGMVQGEVDVRRAVMNGLIFTHTPIINKVAVLTLLVFIFGLILLYRSDWVKKLKEERWVVFCTALSATSVLVFMVQIVTGRTIWPYHFVQYTIPISFVVLVAVYWRILSKKIYLLYVCSALCIGLSIFYGVRSLESYTCSMENFAKQQEYGPVLNWLKDNAVKESVVLVDEPKEELMRLVPAFTALNVYLSGYLGAVPPEERLYHNLLVKMRLEGVNEINAQVYLEAHEIDVREYFFTDWNHLFSKERDPQSDFRINELLKRYKNFLKADFGQELKKYKIDYFITTRIFDMDLLNSLQPKKVYEAKNYVVYRLL